MSTDRSEVDQPSQQIPQQIPQQIRAAFSNRLYPGDNNISDAYGEGPDVRAFYRGKRWQEVDLVPPYKGLGFPWTPLFLTPDAFRYYLPAFLLHSLDCPGPSSFGHEILSLLSPMPPYPDHDPIPLFQVNVSGLMPAECDAIRATFKYLLVRVSAMETGGDTTENIEEAGMRLETFLDIVRRG